LACETHLRHAGKQVKHLRKAATSLTGEGLWDPSPPTPTDSFSRTFRKLWDRYSEATKGEAARALQCAPTTRGPWPPAQRPLLDPRAVTSFLLFLLLTLLSFSSLFLTFWAHKGKVGISLSVCYVLWFCETRHFGVETFAKSISVSNSTALKVMLWSYKAIIFCNSTAIPSKALFLVKLLGHCDDSSVPHRELKSSASPWPTEWEVTGRIKPKSLIKTVSCLIKKTKQKKKQTKTNKTTKTPWCHTPLLLFLWQVPILKGTLHPYF